jgi:glutaredoxin
MLRAIIATLFIAPLLTFAMPAMAGDPEPAATDAGPKVVLYVTSWCSYCRLTSNWLTERGVPFEEKDIETDREALTAYYKAGGNGGVPMVVIGGESIMGYDQQAMARALEAAPSTAEDPKPDAEPGKDTNNPKWPKQTGEADVSREEPGIIIFGDVHEPEVTFITTRDDVADEVELQLERTFLGELVAHTPEDTDE